MNSIEHHLWNEKYRPQFIRDCILPSAMKEGFSRMVEKREIPQLLLYGNSGVGKTTVAKALVKEIDSDYMVINASLQGNIDTLRNDISSFASTVSLSGSDVKKYVILDEADYLTQNMQSALRNFMEEYSSHCGFILTCNIPERIIPALKSRLSQFEFNFEKEKDRIAKEMFSRIVDILENEKISYDKKSVIEILRRNYPDLRKTINEIQKISYTNGEINLKYEISEDVDIEKLIAFLKDKKYKDMRTWVAKNHSDNAKVFRRFYDVAENYIKSSDLPALVVCIAEYQYKDYFAVDKEINLAAFLTECMLNFEWKI